MTWFLDTNICIYYLKGMDPAIKEKLVQTNPNEIKIPVMVASELYYGAIKSKQRNKNLSRIRLFLTPFEIVNYQSEMSQIYGEMRFACEKKGEPVGPNDLLISAIVKYHGGTLITRNIREFRRIPGLKCVGW